MTQVRYLQSSKDAVVLGADVGATAEGGHGDGVPVQHWQVVAVPTVWASGRIVVATSIKDELECKELLSPHMPPAKFTVLS